MLKAPKGKATGADESFAQLFQLRPTLNGELLFKLLEKCGKLAMVPSEWCELALCPLLKKEPANLPKNWRTIALLSHDRKIIEKAIDRRIREQYIFHEAQCGFRDFRSVDTTILRVMRAIDHGCQAYASVPRGGLVAKFRELFSTDVAAMVETLLSKTIVSTVGDEKKAKRRMRRDVAEGTPMSPSLFNVFIDSIAISLEMASEG